MNNYHLLKLNHARNSVRFIIRAFEIKELSLPYYLCDVIRHSVIKENCKINFYHIDDSLMPQNVEKSSYILYPNYFGICDENIDTLEKTYPNLIVDNAHSLLSKPKGIACFNAVHKFTTNDIGSYLWTSNLPPTEFGQKFSDFEVTEIDKNYLHEKFLPLIEQRNKNFKILHDKFGKINNLQIKSITSPFCYPFLADSYEVADKIAKEYIKKGYTIYRYWNNLPKTYNEYKFYERLVPIPLD